MTENVLDGGNPTLFWYGSEVGFDSAGAPVVKTNGKVWDVNSSPLLVEGAEGAVDDVVRVEPSALSDGSLIWLAIKPEGGGGGAQGYADLTSGSGQNYIGDIRTQPNGLGDVIESTVAIKAPNVIFGSIDLADQLIASSIGGVWYLQPSTF